MNVTTGHVGTINTFNVSGISANSSTAILDIPKSINTAINVLTITILFITMISLGCTMEISKIKAHLVKPKGVAIALLAQFCIMPLTAFSLAKILQLHPIKAITVLICGCCPGGSLSNIFSLIVKGDMNLSIVMTTCSSIAALGLMPLLLYVFSQGFTGLENAVPYAGIITALVSTLVPCAVGILINHYKPNYSAAVTKAGLIILTFSTIVVSVLSGFVVKDVIWMIFMPDVVSVAVLMPLIGFTLGYVMSVICRLSPNRLKMAACPEPGSAGFFLMREFFLSTVAFMLAHENFVMKCSRTISMETGCQNIQLCTTILKVAFPPQVIGPMFLFPLLYIMFQCAEALLLALCFRYYQTVKPPAGDTGTQKNVGVNQDEVKQP